MTPTTIRSPRRIAFRQHHANGVLTVYPEGDDGVPFAILRVFTITGVSANGARADHAHRGCSQMLLETHDFQAPEFYRRLGFALTGAVAGYPPGHSLLTMVKRLAASQTV